MHGGGKRSHADLKYSTSRCVPATDSTAPLQSAFDSRSRAARMPDGSFRFTERLQPSAAFMPPVRQVHSRLRIGPECRRDVRVLEAPCGCSCSAGSASRCFDSI